MEKNKVIFLDRDGTINKDLGYVYKKEDLVFTNGAIKGLKKLQDAGFKLIIITNQSGISRGYYNVKDYNNFNNYFLKLLNENNIKIERVYYCPHTDEDNCECRKPKLKLFYDAIKEFNVDLDNSYAIGDKLRDLSICKETNVKGILLNAKDKDHICFDNLLEAAEYIIGDQK